MDFQYDALNLEVDAEYLKLDWSFFQQESIIYNFQINRENIQIKI
jgi:hypothetical protein